MPTGIGNGLAPQTFGQPLSTNSECPAAYCYEFDGISEYAFQSNFIDIGVSDFSVSIWFKTPDVTGGGVDQTLVGTQNFVGQQTWRIYLDTGGKVSFTSSGTGWNDTFASFTPTNDTWHHVVYSVDRSGNAVWFGDVSTTEVTDISTNTTNLYYAFAFGNIAGLPFGAPDLYTGKIADIAMWDIALSASQVSEYYLNSKAPNKLCANSALDTWPNLTGWWRFANPSGTFASPMPTYGSLSTFNFPLFNNGQASVITDYPA